MTSPNDPTPGRVVGSPEEEALVRAIDGRRIASDLERLAVHADGGTLSDRDLTHALRCFEERHIYLDEDRGPHYVRGRYVALTGEQRRAYRDVALRAIAGRGGMFPSDVGAWRSDGERLWRSMA